MSTHKYIRHKLYGFVIWPDSPIIHAEIARAADRKLAHITSAGFVTIIDGTVHCHGRSESLDMKPAPDDSEALAQQLGLRVRGARARLTAQ